MYNERFPFSAEYFSADRRRIAELFLGVTSRTRRPQMGRTRGSVSGPRFWDVIINDLLQKLADLFCCDVTAFVDDLLVCI